MGFEVSDFSFKCQVSSFEMQILRFAQDDKSIVSGFKFQVSTSEPFASLRLTSKSNTVESRVRVGLGGGCAKSCTSLTGSP